MIIQEPPFVLLLRFIICANRHTLERRLGMALWILPQIAVKVLHAAGRSDKGPEPWDLMAGSF